MRYPSKELVKNNLWVLPDDQLKQESDTIVLLVTGANNTGFGAWSWSYAAQLPKQNFIPATITLPHLNTDDLNYSGKFVFEALMQLSEEYPDKRLNIVAHSLGNLVTSWALHYRPTKMALLIDNYIAIGAPFKGVKDLNTQKSGIVKSTGDKQVPANFQVESGSEYTKIINSAPFPNWVGYLSIISSTDEIAAGQDPKYLASFPEGTQGITVTPQEIFGKEGMEIEHVQELADNGIYEIVTSFLQNREIDLNAADTKFYPEMQKPGLELTQLFGSTESHVGDAPKVSQEPISEDIVE